MDVLANDVGDGDRERIVLNDVPASGESFISGEHFPPAESIH